MEKLSYKLETFEGPLDLLLYLITKNKLDICDIQISELLDQYMEQINAMVAAAPDHAILYAVRAGLEQTRKQYEAAEADFTKAISLEPKNIDYLLNRAALYIETKRKKEARADLDKAMELGANPEDVASMRHELR